MCDNSKQYVFNYEFKDVRVKDLIKTKQLETCDLHTTEQGLKNRIKSATVMDIVDIEPWLHEGDVLFISRFMRTSFSDDFVRMVCEKQASCIITQKKFKECVTEAQYDLLQEYHLPLIFVSDDSSWSDMIVVIQNLIIQNQTNYLVENQEFQNSIINYLSSQNVNSLCDIAYSLTGITVAITNRNLKIVDYSKDNDWSDGLKNLKKNLLGESTEIGKNFNEIVMRGHRYKTDEGNYFIIPDWLSRYGVSFYLIVRYDEDEHFLPPQIVGRIETVVSIYSLKHSIMSDLRRSNYYFKSVVFEELLEMTEKDEKKRNHISLNLKTDLKERYFLVLIKNLKDDAICKNVDLLTGFVDYIKHKGYTDEDLLIFVHKDNWVILIDDTILSVKETCTTIHSLLESYFEDSGFVLGISDVHDYWELEQAFKEASFAVDYLDHNHSEYPSLLMYSELGIIKLFTDQDSRINSVYTNELYHNFLKPVISYDAKHLTSLYDTLVTFFSNDLSYMTTSRVLFIHVNTLRARIKTIEKILQIDLSRIDNLINIRLAILLYQFGYFDSE